MYTYNLLVINKVYRTLLFDESNLGSNWSDEGMVWVTVNCTLSEPVVNTI